MNIRFGTARRCINPQVPVSLAGYFNVRMWDQILDDLEVRAVVFKHGPDYAAILNVDLVTVPLFICDGIFAALQEMGITALTRENTLIDAIHTHTGPEIRPIQGHNPAYFPYFVKQAAEALAEAFQSLRDGELFYGQTEDNRFLFNRRYWMKDGKVLTNPGKLNPDIVRPEGEIDPDIPLLGIKSGNKLEVVLCSIVNHTDTIGGNGVSADWPGFLRRTIEKEMGPNSMFCTMIGASGNINHFDVRTDMNQTCYAEAERIGLGYAETILKALSGLQKVEGDFFKVIHGEANTTAREISKEEVAAAQEVVDKYADLEIGEGTDMTSEDLANGAPVVLKYFAKELLNRAANKEKYRFFLTGFAFGSSVIIASLPSEPFTEIGLILRREIFKNRVCLVAALANGTGSYLNAGGYIPNAWNYGRGGYETQPRSNPFSMGCASDILNKWREIAKDL